MENATKTKHPTGLWYLFGTEMWERFGYYLMLGIFTLYMKDGWNNGGMGFDAQKKSDIYGTYLGLVYLTPFIGGLLADRLLGYRRSIIIGGLMMSAGYFALSIHSETSFFVALFLIIMGNGFFKPNISTLVGNLYSSDEMKDKKDAGYNIFYMGINIGAFICNFVAAYMRINYGWGHAFAAAGAGMLIGVIIFLLGTKHIKHVDVIKPVQKGDMSTAKIFSYTVLPMFAFGVLGYILPGNFLGSDTNDAFIIGCLPVIAFFIFLAFRGDPKESRAIKALLAVFACVILFFAIFHQNGDALTVWAEDHTDREMSNTISDAADKMGIAQIVVNSNYTTKETTGANNLLTNNLITYPDQTELDRKLTKDYLKKAEIFSKSYKYFVSQPKYAPKKVSVTIDSNLLNQINAYSQTIKDSSEQAFINSALISLYGIPIQHLPKGFENKTYLNKLIKCHQSQLSKINQKIKKIESGKYKATDEESTAALTAIEENTNKNFKEGKSKQPFENFSESELNAQIQDHLLLESQAKLISLNDNLYLLQFVIKHNAFKKYEGELPNLKLYSTELYQSINPFWVVVLTPIVVGFFGWLRRRKKEPSTPTKIAIGLIITALSALVMVGAVLSTNDLTLKAGSWWLFASYGVITVGELCLSPMGLSLVSKLSPPRITALMMGGFFLAISVGNKLSGMLSSLWEKIPEKQNFFYLNFGLVLAAAIILILMLKWLNSVMRENNVH